MNFSVIIPAFGSRTLTEQCIASVYTHDRNAEVVLVDNDGQATGLDADVYLYNRENVGFARACNQGAWASLGDILVFLNNDTRILEPKTLHQLAEYAQAYGVAGCHLVYPSGATQHAGVLVYRRPDGCLWMENIKDGGPSRVVPAVTGACLAIRRSLFAELEGFQTAFYNGGEDVHLCLSVRLAGARCWYAADLTVEHREGASGPERWKNVQQNVQLFHRIWDPVFEQLPAV